MLMCCNRGAKGTLSRGRPLVSIGLILLSVGVRLISVPVGLTLESSFGTAVPTRMMP